MILPAALRYQKEVGESVAAAKAAGAASTAGIEVLSTVGQRDQRSRPRRSPRWKKPISHHGDGDAYAHAKHMREHVIPAMLEVRKAADKLEDHRRRRPLAAADVSRNAVSSSSAELI